MHAKNATRRVLLRGIAGGVAAYEAMSLPRAVAAPMPAFPPTLGRGVRVAVLGAGVGGLCAAYELQKLGFEVAVLESSERAGGRSLTLRKGDRFQEIDGPVQTCTFEDGGWMNAGPGRIPQHHVDVVDYCRELGVTLEPYIFSGRTNLDTRGAPEGSVRQPMPVGRIVNDLRGQVAAMLDQCMKRSGAPQNLELSAMLKEFGGLSGDPAKPDPLTYTNATGRAGYIDPPGLLVPPPNPLPPLSMDDLVKSKVWQDSVFRETRYYWQSTLLQPAGGMDMFWKGFMRQKLRHTPGRNVANLVRYRARVDTVEMKPSTVVLGINGRASLEVDYVVSTVPMPIFASMKSNLDAAYLKAAAAIPIVKAGKVGWQAERFWEQNDQIYGGISWVDGLVDQVWYPSDGFLSRLGVLTGAYMTGDKAAEFDSKPVRERLEISRAAIDRMHPGQGKNLMHGVAIAWERMEHIRMGFVDEGSHAFRDNAPVVAAPQGNRLFQAGDQLTWLSGWQQGAILSAKLAVRQIAERTKGG
jgi:monoamine oxidase